MSDFAEIFTTGSTQGRENSERKFSHRAIQICENQSPISSPLQMKNRITFGTFWASSVKIRAWSKVNQSESKFNLAYAGAINYGLLNMKKVWSIRFPILSLLVTKNISEKILTKISSFAAFSNTTPTYLKKIH